MATILCILTSFYFALLISPSLGFRRIKSIRPNLRLSVNWYNLIQSLSEPEGTIRYSPIDVDLKRLDLEERRYQSNLALENLRFHQEETRYNETRAHEIKKIELEYVRHNETLRFHEETFRNQKLQTYIFAAALLLSIRLLYNLYEASQSGKALTLVITKKFMDTVEKTNYVAVRAISVPFFTSVIFNIMTRSS